MTDSEFNDKTIKISKFLERIVKELNGLRQEMIKVEEAIRDCSPIKLK